MVCLFISFFRKKNWFDPHQKESRTTDRLPALFYELPSIAQYKY